MLAWLLTQLESNYPIEAGAKQLDFNLATLKVELHGVELAAQGNAAAPFLEVERISLDLPQSAIWSGFAIEAVELVHPRLSVIRSSDGSLNLPEGSESTSPSAPSQALPIEIGRLAIRDLDVHWEDRAAPLTLSVEGINLELNPVENGIAGPLTLSGPSRLRRVKETSITRLEGAVAFDGLGLALENVGIELPEGYLEVEGTIAPLLADPLLKLTYCGQLDLGQTSGWIDPSPAVSGRLAVSGEIAGPVAAPTISLVLAGDDLAWADFRSVSIRGATYIADSVADIESLTLHVAGAEVGAQGQISFGDQRTGGDLTLEWHEVSAGPLLAAAGLALPFQPAASMEGRLEARWTELNPSAVELTLENRSRPPDRVEEGLPIDGRFALNVGGGRWTLAADHRIAWEVQFDGQAQGQIPSDTDAPMQSSLAGRFTLDVSDLGRSLSRLGHTWLAGAPDGERSGGRLQATVDLSGTLAEPRFAGTTSASRLRFRDLASSEVEAHFRGDSEHVAVESFNAHIGANHVHATGAIVFDTQTVQGQFEARLPDLSELDPVMPRRWNLAGTGNLDGNVSGRWPQPRIEIAVNGAGLRVAGQIIDQLSGRFSVENGIVTVEELEVVQSDGHLALSGHYEVESGNYAASGTGRNLQVLPLQANDPDETPLPLSARFNVDFEGAGSLSEPQGRGQLDVSSFAWAGLDLGSSETSISLADGSLSLRSEIPKLRATLDASLQVSGPPTFELNALVEDADLAQLTADAVTPSGRTVPLTGTVSLGIRAAGNLDELDAMTLTLDLERLDAQLGDTAVRLQHPAQLEYSDDEIHAEGVEITFGGTTLRATGRIARDRRGDVEASLEGDLADFSDLLSIARSLGPDPLPPIEMKGPLGVTVTASGTRDHPTLSADLRLQDASVRVDEQPPVSGLTTLLAYDDEGLHLEKLEGTWQGATVVASGYLPANLLGPHLPAWYRDTLPATSELGMVRTRIDSLTPAVLAPFLDSTTLEKLGGEITATVTLETDALELDHILGELTLTSADVVIGGVPLSQRRPTRIELAGHRVSIAEWDWGGPESDFAVSGSVDLLDGPIFDLSTVGHVDLRVLSAFLQGVGTAGQARLDARLSGSATDLEVDGTIQLSEVELRIAEPRIAVTDLTGNIQLARDRLTTSELTGNANGGKIRFDGELNYPGLHLADGSMSMGARGLALEFPRGLRGEIDADLTLALAEGEMTLSGSISVLRGDYRDPLIITAGLLAALRQRSIVVASAPEPSALDDLRLDVRLLTEEDLSVDNNYARVELAANLTLVGTLARPALVGRATLGEGGEIFLGGNAYQLERGFVDFSNPTRIEPELDLTARTRVSGYDITLNLTGTPDTLDTDLFSDPPLSNSDIVSLLLTGRTLDQLGGAEGAIAGEQALSIVSGEFLGVAGRTVGLDTVRLERGSGSQDVLFDPSLVATETDPRSRLTFGKQVSRDLTLIFSQNLKQNGALTWIVSYTPARSLELRWVLRDDKDQSYEFRHDISFGGGPPPTAPSPSVTKRRTEDQRVRSVRFTGNPGFSERELLDQINVSVGDRFDFYRWDEDRDRLERFYHQRGFRQVRIRSTRFDVADGSTPRSGGIELTYDVRQGPTTTLTVEGYQPPDRLQRDMEGAWTRSVFDGFLLDELQAMARTHLASVGYLRPTIATEIKERQERDEKEIVLHIEPGRQTNDRRLDLRGNEQIAIDRIERFITEHGLQQVAWTDPPSLEAALESLYRGAGLLAASVDVGEPVLDGDTASLPITVQEGPLFRISEVTLEGVNSRPGPEVWTVLGLEPGSVFSEAGVQEARVRLDSSYRRAGFNAVNVAADATMDRDAGTVAVKVVVEEGPRQVLEDVAVSGARRTHPGIIDRALQLDIGEPVDLADWYRARRRLYNSGAFRSVSIDVEPMKSTPPPAQELEHAQIEPVRAQVSLEEWPSFRLRYGLEILNEANPTREVSPDPGGGGTIGFSSDLTHRNFLGRAATLGVAFRYDSAQRVVRGFTSTPLMFGLPIRSSLFVSRSREHFGDESILPFIRDESKVTAEQRFRPASHVLVSYSYNFERNHTSPEDPDPDDPFFPDFDLTIDIARLNTTAVLDTRDDLVDATRGWFHSSSFEYAARGLGSDLRFAKYFGRQNYYRRLPRDIVLASGATVGLAWGFDQDLIPSERFFAGGANSVRGYAEDALGPRNIFGDPAGGDALFELSQEIRFPVVGMFRGVGFVDGGNVFRSISDFSFTGLKGGIGLGLRAGTPFALLRLDFGMPFSRESGEPGGVWYFSFGQKF